MISDYIPHGLIVALGGVVTWVYRQHVQQDDDRYKQLTDVLGKVFAGQNETRAKMSDNHAELLKLMVDQSPRRRKK